MTEAWAIEAIRQLLWMVMTLAGPVIVGGLIVGVAVAVVQAATQIQEQSLTFLPKLLLAIGTVSIGGPWALGKLIFYTVSMFEEVAVLSPGFTG